MDTAKTLEEFIALWSVIDPIGTLPVFVALTAHFEPKRRAQTARKATLIAGIVLTFFIVAGQVLLEAMGIPLAAFEIAGGIVLFLFALTMIFGESKPEQEAHLPKDLLDVAVYPLALPSLASPGAILAVVMLTENHRFSWVHQAYTWAVMMVVLLCAWLIMKLATPLTRLIGKAGASVLSRVMGIIIAAIAVHAALEGLSHYFDLTTIERSAEVHSGPG